MDDDLDPRGAAAAEGPLLGPPKRTAAQPVLAPGARAAVANLTDAVRGVVMHVLESIGSEKIDADNKENKGMKSRFIQEIFLYFKKLRLFNSD